MIDIPPGLLDTLGNKEWRMGRLYDIVDRDGNKVVFRRNEAQQDFQKNKASRNLILKSRRLGFTTDEAIDSLDDSLWNPNFHAQILSYDVASQLDIFDNKVSFAWENFLLWMVANQLQVPWGLDMDRNNQLKFNFGDGSTSSIQVRTRGRGGSVNRVHVSEMGTIAKADPIKAREIITGTIQAVPLSGRVDIESTAEGDYGEFHDMFWEAWDRGEPTTPVEYKAHFYNWMWDFAEIRKILVPDPNIPAEFRDYQRRHNELAAADRRLKPINDIELTYYYRRWITLNRDWDRLHSEYPTTPEEAFVASGARLFDMIKIDRMPTETGRRLTSGDVQGWIFYNDFVPGHRYCLGADPSEGKGQNNATIAVLDLDHKIEVSVIGSQEGKISITRPKLVAEYASSRIDPTQFAYEIKNGGERYGHCIAGVELNNSGWATVSKLREIYHNIYKSVKPGRTEDEQTEELGWRTTASTKPKMLYDLNADINNDAILVTSAPTKRELKSYDKENLGVVKFDEDAAHHWDRVIALAIARQMMPHAVPSAMPGQKRYSGDEFTDPMDKHGMIG